MLRLAVIESSLSNQKLFLNLVSNFVVLFVLIALYLAQSKEVPRKADTINRNYWIYLWMLFWFCRNHLRRREEWCTHIQIKYGSFHWTTRRLKLCLRGFTDLQKPPSFTAILHFPSQILWSSAQDMLILRNMSGVMGNGGRAENSLRKKDWIFSVHFTHYIKWNLQMTHSIYCSQSRIHVNVRARQAAMRVPVDVLALVLTGYMYLTVTGV